MTPAAPRCPDKRFRTERYARRYAWALHSNPAERLVPVPCAGCGAWHLAPRDAAPDQPRRTDGDGQQQRS